MKSKTLTVGALHPILFFAVMYFVVLLLSIFICSSIFYSFNDSTSAIETEKTATASTSSTSSTFSVPVAAAVVR